jgi:hypothetical protein
MTTASTPLQVPTLEQLLLRIEEIKPILTATPTRPRPTAASPRPTSTR